MRTYNRLTLTQQWITATLLALLPLAIAVIYAGGSLARQTQSQRDMVLTIDRLSHLDASINNQVTSIERYARQYLLLRRAKFLDLFQQNVTVLADAQSQLRQYLSDPESIEALTRIVDEAQGLLLDVPPDVIDQEGVLGALQKANQQVGHLSGEIDATVQDLVARGDKEFERVMHHLLLIGVLAIPGTILLVVLSSVAVARPMWRLAHSIRELGHEHWQKPIAIEGPADLRSLGASLEWMRQRLDTSEKQKQAFLRHITHELKTPLAAIMEAGSLLRDEVPGSVNKAQQQVLKILINNADSLQMLIQQLLNYNAVAHGMLNADANVDLAAMCQKIRRKLQDTRSTSACRWSVAGEPNEIRTDPQALEMILSNLLSNARDFTPESGRVAVRWGMEADHWWLTVTDSGPGFSEEEQEHIFKPFYQGKARRQGPLKGTGLGLAIVYECVTHLNGSVSVVSGQEGSQFSLRFPLRREIII